MTQVSLKLFRLLLIYLETSEDLLLAEETNWITSQIYIITVRNEYIYIYIYIIIIILYGIYTHAHTKTLNIVYTYVSY